MADEDNDSIDVLNDRLTTVIIESAEAVSGEEPKTETGKLSQKTKDLIEKRRHMKGSSTSDQTELAELSKLINRSKIADIRACNMAKIESTLKAEEV